jgi:hypothetical protein
MQLTAIEVRGCGQHRYQTEPLVQQRHCLRELHLVIQFGEANDVTAAAAAVTVKQILAGIHEKTGLVVLV